MMKKQLLAALGALLLAGCATWNYPLEEAGDGVYYAESPPDYVYFDYGLSYGSMYPWLGPPYLYPMSYYSPYVYLGSRWYHPPFGTVGYWAMDPYDWHRKLSHTPYRQPAPYAYKSGDMQVYRKSATGRYPTGYPPQSRVKANVPRSAVRPSAATPVRSAPPPRMSRPARSMRSAPAPKSSLRATRRDRD